MLVLTCSCGSTNITCTGIIDKDCWYECNTCGSTAVITDGLDIQLQVPEGNKFDSNEVHEHEEEELNSLVRNIRKALLTDEYGATIVIRVNNTNHEFMLGGVQATGLHAFITSVAGENLHDVDFNQV